MSDHVLRLDDVHTDIGEYQVLHGISFDVPEGGVHVLLGRNGAGKTTTLRAIAGLNRVTGGQVEYLGADITAQGTPERVALGMSYVQEGKRVLRAQTVEQNLVLGTISRGLSRAEIHREVHAIYELFPILGEKAKLPAGSMSGGQQQRLAIGAALMAKP